MSEGLQTATTNIGSTYNVHVAGLAALAAWIAWLR